MNMRNGKQVLSFVLLLIMMACANQQVMAESFPLGAGDIIKITVYGQPDLTTMTRIAEDGKITFPLIGDVKVGGQSTAQSEHTIAEMLQAKGIVKNPTVNIFLDQRSQTLANSVTVLGQVAKPGKYPVQDISVPGVKTLVDLLAMAGGTNANAADYLLLVKNQDKEQKKVRVDLVSLIKNGSLDSNYLLNGGDIILVPEMDVFYIYGKVEHPGRYRLERGMSVMQALSVAGGVADRGSESGMVIKRRGPNGIQSLNAAITDALQPDDVIYIKESIF